MANVWIDDGTMGSIGDAIRSKTKKSDKILPANMPSEIESIVTNPPLQEKSVTSNGTVEADEGFYGLSKVTINVPTGSSGSSGSSGGSLVPNGHIARFYNENGDLIQTISTIPSIWIDRPLYECDNWENSNGFVNSFPLMLEGDVDFYAKMNEYCSEKLYNFFNFNKTTYPYLLVTCQWVTDRYHYCAYFSSTMPYVTESSWAYSAGKIVRCNSLNENFGTDMVLVTEVIIQHYNSTVDVGNQEGSYNRNSLGYHKIYGNFDNNKLDGRLDQTKFTA